MPNSSFAQAQHQPMHANPFFDVIAINNYLEYAYQPIVCAITGQVYGIEALVRGVNHFGMKTPLDLFDAAYAHNMLGPLDLILRKKAIEGFSRIRRPVDCKLFYNVDGRTLEIEGYLLEETARLAALSGIEPKSICFEISETSQIDNYDAIQTFCDQASTLGFLFAIDDFGQGYSQLKALYDFDLDILKIDRFFIKDIAADRKKRLFVSTILDLAHVLKMKVVAEGIETDEELRACQALGCDLIQGYLIEHPSTELKLPGPLYPIVSRPGNEFCLKGGLR